MDTRFAGFLSRIGSAFLGAIDLSDNLVWITRSLKGVPNGAISLVTALGSLIGLIGFGSLAYYLDIESSWVAMASLRERVVVATGGLAAGTFLGWLVQVVPTALTVLPTVSEMLGSRFAQFGIPAFRVVTWKFIVWDLATDIPRVNEIMEPLWNNFVRGTKATSLLGILLTFDPRIIGGYVGYYIVWVLVLVGASYFAELITVLLLWAFVASLWKSIGYWISLLLRGRRAYFSGDIGGAHDPDYDPRSRAQQRGSPRPSNPSQGVRGAPQAQAPRREAPRAPAGPPPGVDFDAELDAAAEQVVEEMRRRASRSPL